MLQENSQKNLYDYATVLPKNHIHILYNNMSRLIQSIRNEHNKKTRTKKTSQAEKIKTDLARATVKTCALCCASFVKYKFLTREG